MDIKKLKKANDLSQKIEFLNKKIDSIAEINNQATSSCSALGLNLAFVNVRNPTGRSSFCASTDEMKFIINYLTESWQQQKKELETEFEQL